MNLPLELPPHGIFVSAIGATQRNLTIRFVSDYHPDAQPEAYNLTACDVENLEQALAHFADLKERSMYVYAFWRENALVVTEEDGDELVVSAKSFSGTADKFNAEELAEMLVRVYAWYLSESARSRKLDNKVNNAKVLLHEQARRVELKSAAHPSAGTAGILYAQQMQFIDRVLGVFED